MDIKLKSENNLHIATVNGHKIIFDDLTVALDYIFMIKS